MKKLTNKEIDDRILYLNPNIKRIGEYNKGKMFFKCDKDGYIWNTRLQDVFRGHGCPKCAGTAKLTNSDIDKFIFSKNLKRLEDYVNSSTKIKFKCLICENIVNTKPNDIFNGHGCPKCAGVKKLSNEVLDERLEKTSLKRIGKYVNNRTKIDFKCMHCNLIWKAKPNNILDGHTGCPKCSMYKNEKLVYDYIKKFIKYDTFTYHKLIRINNKKITPDFYLEINNKKIIIEYNGEQHYRPVKFNGISYKASVLNFYNQLIRDNLLQNYCDTNKIILIILPFYLSQNELEDEIKNLNLSFHPIKQVAILKSS